jgi:hypothetical protein
VPTEIQNPVAARALVDAFDIKGRFRMLLDEMVAPVVIVGDVRPTTIGGATFQDHASIAAVAGENGALLITGGDVPRFPFTTILHRIRVRAIGTASTWVIALDNTTAFVLTNAADLTGRNRLAPTRPPSPVCAVAGALPATAGQVIEIAALPADTDVVIDLEGWELPPGPAVLGQFARIAMWSTVANIALNVSLTWSIRQAGE